MGDGAERLRDPKFQQYLKQRSRLRWGYSGLLLGVYLLWGICGIYFSDFYARPFMGIALPTGLAMGFLIIALAMIMAVAYVGQVNRVENRRIADGINQQ